MTRARAPLGVTFLAYLGFMVAITAALLGVAAALGARAVIARVLLLPEPLVVPALILAVALLVSAGLGLLRRARWAWALAIALVALSAIPDIARLTRRDPSGFAGLLAVGAMVWYLLRPEVRAWVRATG